MKSSLRSLFGVPAVCVLSAGLVLLTGCGLGNNAGTVAKTTTGGGDSSTPIAQPGYITGTGHGGRQPINGGYVTLWAAGTSTGYGAGATAIASTTTNGSGQFSLDISAGTSPCTPGQYNYITITGGDPGGGSNAASALLLALPNSCVPAITGGLNVYVTEITTVASVWALQQFMSITPANGPYTSSSPTPPWNIGAPSTNVTGLKNAFATVAQIVPNLANGVSTTSMVSSTVTVGSTPTNYYTLVTPDFARVYMVADILASCVNTTDNVGDSASAVCSNLFTDVSPSGAVLPTDTIQAAYDIATAPAGITQYARAGTSATIAAGTALASPAGSCSLTGCEWALAMCDDFVVANTPFTTTACSTGTTAVASYPSDFAIGVRWSSYDSNTLSYGIKNGYAAIDGNGDIWSANGGTSAGTGLPIQEWDAQGHVLQVAGGTYTMPSSTVSVYLTTAANVPSSTATTFSYSSPPTASMAAGSLPFVAGAIAVDSNNNLWMTDNAGGVVGAVLSNGGSSFYPGLLVKVPTATVTATSTSISQATSITADAVASNVATFTSNNSFTTGESLVLAGFGTNTFLNGQTVTVIASTGTTFTAAVTHADYAVVTEAGYAAPPPTAATSTAATQTPYITGAYPGAIAIDNANNIWLHTASTSGTGNSGNLTLMTAASNYLNIYEGQYLSGNTFEQVMVDGLNDYGWGLLNTSTVGKPIYRESASTMGSGTVNALNTTGINYGSIVPRWGILDGSSNIWLAENKSGTGQIGYVNAQASLTPALSNAHASSTATSYAANTFFGGLQSPLAMAVDGVGNVFIGNGVTSTASGTTVISSTGTQLTPTNQGSGMPVFGLNIYATDQGKAMQIDSSGNLWTGAGSNSYQVHMVGLAAPVITPAASAVTPATANITAWSIDSSGTLATFTVANNYTTGQYARLSGFGTSTFFNGQTVTVLSSGLSGTQFQAQVTGGTASTSATEAGISSTSRVGTRP